MKWKMFGLAALAAVAVSANAQESRQDVSVSGTGLFPTRVIGDTVTATADSTYGGLASYRFMVTPRTAVELNYQYSQTTFGFVNSSNTGFVNSRVEELSGEYLYTRNYGNFNPFVGAGPGGFVFSPISDSSSTTVHFARRNTNVGLVFGAGLAYQISPSFDIRAEYRAFVAKEPSFNLSNDPFRTDKYSFFSNPAIGVAYHF